MRSHTQRAAVMYGSTEKPKSAAAPLPTLSRDAAAKRLYSGSGTLSDQPFNSAYSPRINRAKQNDDHLEAARLEAEERELRQLATELKLSDPQALKVANALRDTARTPLTRTQILETERLHLSKKFGPQVGDVVHSAAVHVNKLLETKPTLLEAIKRGHTWVHGDVVETAAEAVQALGLVKPIA